MEKDKKFWTNELTTVHHYGVKQELRAHLAWELIRTHPNIAGIEAGEDSTGRSRLKLQTPEELVARSFAIADLFVSTAVERGELVEVELTDEQRAEKVGRLDSIREETRYNFMRQKAERH